MTSFGYVIMLSSVLRRSLLIALAAMMLAGCFGTETTTVINPGDDQQPVDPTPVVDKRGPEDDVKKNPDEPSNTDPGQTVDPTTVADDARGEMKELAAAELVTRLGDSELRAVASDELAARGEESVDALTAALDSEDSQVKSQAIFTLGRLEGDATAALPRLKEIAKTADSDVVRDAAAYAIDAIEGN